MIGSIARTWSPILTALAVLLVHTALGPGVVHASCGDYVTVTVVGDGQPVRQHAPTAEVTTTGRGAPQTGSIRPSPCSRCPMVPGKAPCQGPWCSGSHAPLVPPVVNVQYIVDPCICRRVILALEQSAAPSCAADATARGIEWIDSIFHPPRVA